MQHNGRHRDDGGTQCPPLSVEVLIEFRAGRLDPATADRVRAGIASDPAAQRALAALDATDADLATLRDEEIPIPPDVRARMLDTIRRFPRD